MKLKLCPKCNVLPDFIQFPFNKFWKGSCFKCGLSGEAHKKKSDANKSWNNAVSEMKGEGCENG